MMNLSKLRGTERKRHENTRIAGISLTLKIADEMALFILLGNDGLINRMGTGSDSDFEMEMFIGMTSASAFLQTAKLAPAVIENWTGGFAGSVIVGKLCALTVVFMTLKGEEIISQWKYGSESQGPPPEVSQLVDAAVEATDDWYKEQKRLAIEPNKLGD